MNGLDMILMAVRNLWKRKLRTFLTVLGVIIGTASIVVMISIGIGMNEGFKEQLSQWGNLHVINVNAPYDNGIAEPGKTVVTLDDNAIQSFASIPGVEAATPKLSTYMMLTAGKYVCDVSFVGINPDAMEALGYTVSEGRLLNEEDKNALVVGAYVAENFYNPKLSWRMRYSSEPPTVNLFEDKIQITYDWSYGTNNADKKIKPVKAEVVGVLEGTGNDSYSVIMPLKDLQKIMQDQKKYQESQGWSSSGTKRNTKVTYDQALVKVANMDDVQDIQQQIKDMGYEAWSLSDDLARMQETSKMMQMVLGAIGAVSLLVAAIGITNTMVMSIYERTREIGIMKVIGASLKDIQGLFLTEAAFIGCIGGVFGIVLSYIVSKIVNVVGVSLGQSSTLSLIPPWLALAALVFATFVGVGAGYFPAKRAMKLSALTAIKTE